MLSQRRFALAVIDRAMQVEPWGCRQAWRGCSALVQRSILRQPTRSTIHRKVDQRKPNNNKHNIQQNGFAALTCNEGHLFTSILYSTPKICTAQYRKPSNAIKRCPYRFCANPRRSNGRIEFNVFYILKESQVTARRINTISPWSLPNPRTIQGILSSATHKMNPIRAK